MRGYRWAGFRRSRLESCTWAIFVGSVPSVPAVISAALSDDFKNALMEPDKINKNLLLFDIITGDNDEIVGKHVTEFEDRLKQANVATCLYGRTRRNS